MSLLAMIPPSRTCLTYFAAFSLGISKPLLFAQQTAEGSKSIKPFSLPIWSQDAIYNLSDEPTAIVVLDFFAYWCIPCLQTSRELELNIQRYYDELGGNPNGLPVRVLSINVESRLPQKTEEFIKKAGVRLALHDAGGQLLEQLGGKALPFVVVINNPAGDSESDWNVLYQSSGYKGSESLRRVIDGITPSIPISIVESQPKTTETEKKGVIEPDLTNERPNTGEAVARIEDKSSEERGGPKTVSTQERDEKKNEAQTTEARPHATVASDQTETVSTTQPDLLLPVRGIDYSANADVLTSSDISLYAFGLQRNQDFTASGLDLLVSYGVIDIDYEPFPEADVIGRPTHLRETSPSAQVTVNLNPSSFIEYQLSGGGYQGFSDHNSLWLDEYYHQQFSGLEGYEEADPWGYNVSSGFTWDTTSIFGILSATVIFQQDDVAPGYDRPLFQPLERGRERLKTNSLLLEQESVLTPTTRVRHQLQLTKTTDRELRYRYNGNLNVALSENWVARLEGAYTFEAVDELGESNFKSHSVGWVVERDWDQIWFLSFTGRRYSDNGQIETSILVSAGPPPLDTDHFGIALRHQGESGSWKLSLASYQTRYDEIDSPIRPFGNLYQDRDWLLASASYNHAF